MVIKKTAATLFFSTAAIAVTCLLQPAPAAAMVQTTQQETTNAILNINNTPLFSARMSLGYMDGEAGEYWYVPEIGHKLSELDWKFEEVFMLGLGGSLSPNSWLTFNLDFWINLNEGDNTMDDYDWYLTGYTYTNWSHHDETDLKTAFSLDFNGEFAFYQYQTSKFFGIAGFKYDTYELEAYGGSYIYSANYLYDTVFTVDNGTKIITYEQNYYAPYVGIGFSSSLWETPLNFSGRVIFAPYVWGDDKDQHYMRDLVFEQDFDSGTMFAVDFTAKYYFTPNFTTWLGFQYQNYDEMKGESTITDTTNGAQTKATGDVAGMDSEAMMFSLGVSFDF
jgi:plasminogen activator